MYRQFAAILFLTAFLLQVFQQNVLVLDYTFNTAAFAKACENKPRPVMHCNGKCQLMKKLQEEEKKEQQNPGHKAENKNDVASVQTSFATLPQLSLTASLTHHPHFLTAYPRGTSFDIFRPPSMS